MSNEGESEEFIEPVPFPNPMVSEVVQYEEVTNIRPGDEIKVVDGETVENRFVILSIRENEELYVYDYIAENYSLFNKKEMKELMENDSSYHWALLYRHQFPVSNHPGKTIVVYIYAAENSEVPDRDKLVMLWSVTNQRPVQNIPEADGGMVRATFAELRSDIRNISDNQFEELYENFSEDLVEKFDLSVVYAEFNAESRLTVYTEPTYGEDLSEELERNAQKQEEWSQEANLLYD